MKKTSLIIMALFMAIFAQAQDTFISSMNENITKIQEAKTVVELQNVANNFERIAQVAEGEWLPNYYHSYISINMAIKSFSTKDWPAFEKFVAQSKASLEVANSKTPPNAELLVLKAFISQIEIIRDPMVKGPLLTKELMTDIHTAMAMDADNPRANLVLGKQYLYMPSFLGGSKEKAKEQFTLAELKFKSQKCKTDENGDPKITPSWGEQATQRAIASIAEPGEE